MRVIAKARSILLKPCPHCGTQIATHELASVPREKNERWFQFTASPHAACPKCGGFVVSSAANSPWLLVFVFYMVILLGSIYFDTPLGDFLLSGWGKLLSFVLLIAIMFRVMAKSKLRRE
jgi:ribosomal protein S27AE